MDKASHMLFSDPVELKILAKLGDQRAILLLDTCIAFNKAQVQND